MSKILFVANVHQHFLDCHLPYIAWLTEQGHDVHVAAGGTEVVPFASRQFVLSIRRSPFRWQNIQAFFELKKLIATNGYDLVHCHTPMGGVLARLAARTFWNKGMLKVLYTAHGFYIYKGAPLPYWLLYFPAEKFLSRLTDGLITINQEDHAHAHQYRFRSREIFRINGIGIDHRRFSPISDEEKTHYRREYGFRETDFLLIYAAEFIPRKNHRFLIDSLPGLIREIPGLKLIFAGTGPIIEELKAYATKAGVQDHIWFAGFRHDIDKLMSMSDCYIVYILTDIPANFTLICPRFVHRMSTLRLCLTKSC